MLLEGKKALITGSRRGIGRGIAVLFAREGADVGINDIVEDDLARETVRMVQETGRKATFHRADVSRAEEINRMFDEFLREHGRIDILVNNAYSSGWSSFLDITEEEWDQTIASTLKGYFLCAQRAAREMVRQGTGGRIICISSVHAFRAWPNDTVYGIAKAGLVRMVKSMAVDLAGTGITANCIAPGYIDSRVLPPEQEHLRGGPGYADHAMPWIPNRRGGTPTDIARACLFLASELGDYVNGETLLVDGGFLAGGTPD